jgi:hypothetical protein
MLLMIPLLLLWIALSRSGRESSESLPDPLETIQQGIGQGQEVQLVPAKGRPAWSQWFINNSARDTVSADGYFTVEAFEEGTMLELARELPVSAYRLRARVRHNKVMRQGAVGIYVGGRSARATGQEGRFFFALRYDGITDESKLLAQLQREANPGKPPVLPPGNAVSLKAYLHVHPDLGPWWGRGFGGVDGVWLKPSGFGADAWRDLEITVGPGSLKASLGGMPFKPLLIDVFTPDVEHQFNKVIAVDAAHRDFLHQLPPRFDPHGSLGLFVSDSSASFSDVYVSPPDAGAK